LSILLILSKNESVHNYTEKSEPLRREEREEFLSESGAPEKEPPAVDSILIINITLNRKERRTLMSCVLSKLVKVKRILWSFYLF